MFVDAFTYLTKGDDPLRTIVIGGVLTLFSVFILPLFFLSGYTVRVLEHTSTGKEEPPAFDNWGALFVDGLKIIVISLGYLLVPMVIGGGLLVVAIMGLSAGSEATTTLGGVGVVLALLIGGGLTLLMGYLLPAAAANFADKHTIRSGFEFDTLRHVWTHRDYAVAWGTGFVIILSGMAISMILNVLPLIGTLMGIFVGFYCGVAAYYVIGHAWTDLRSVSPHRQISQ